MLSKYRGKVYITIMTHYTVWFDFIPCIFKHNLLCHMKHPHNNEDIVTFGVKSTSSGVQYCYFCMLYYYNGLVKVL